MARGEQRELPFERYRDSASLVARLTLPSMAYPPEGKLEVYHAAFRGLLDLESDPERQAKYLDFVDLYAALDDQELAQYRERYPEEVEAMSGFAERYREKGLEQGLEQGRQQGEASLLLHQLEAKFGALTAAQRRRVEEADPETLLEWSRRVLTAERLEDIWG